MTYGNYAGCDCIGVNVRSLKSLDTTSTQYGPVSIVMSKFPNDMKLLVSRYLTSITSSSESAGWKIEDLIKFVKQEIEAREKCHLVSNNLNDKRKSVDHHPNNYTASALFTGTGEYPRSTCIYCRKDHP